MCRSGRVGHNGSALSPLIFKQFQKVLKYKKIAFHFRQTKEFFFLSIHQIIHLPNQQVHSSILNRRKATAEKVNQSGTFHPLEFKAHSTDCLHSYFITEVRFIQLNAESSVLHND